ncbi:MAG TPA: hypothetical protein VKQ36_11190, partial [Ktedonobacterales bacterium]|nr:hypothetical protein [Ktedonobacterales bacterium]
RLGLRIQQPGAGMSRRVTLAGPGFVVEMDNYRFSAVNAARQAAIDAQRDEAAAAMARLSAFANASEDDIPLPPRPLPGVAASIPGAHIMPALPASPYAQLASASLTGVVASPPGLPVPSPEESGVTRPLPIMEQAAPTTPLPPTGLTLNEAPPTRPLASATAQEGATWVNSDEQGQPKPRRFWPLPNLLGRRNNGTPPAPRNRE